MEKELAAFSLTLDAMIAKRWTATLEEISFAIPNKVIFHDSRR